MKKAASYLQESFLPLILIAITGFLAWVNYVPGTVLSGWDTLHPEFNLSLYLVRTFFGVWQEHQGVGAVASQAHAAEITRIPFILLESLFIPGDLVRYVFFFLCLGLGALGVYFLSRYIVRRHYEKISSTSAFIAASFYVLNLTTLQQFAVPLEMFAIHFAAVPWLFYFAGKYLREGERKNIVSFALVTLFSSGMAHTATLFYVYLACLGLFLFSDFVMDAGRAKFKKSVVLLGAALILNSFWLLPNLYYIKNHGTEVANSQIHSNFSDEAFLQSKNYGDLYDLSLQKNFLFNWRAFDYGQNKYTDLLGEWKVHLDQPFVTEIGQIFFLMSVAGFVFAIFKKEKHLIAFFLPVALCIVFWINANGPLTSLFENLRNSSVLFREGLRFPFTKFSIILVMGMSLCLGFFVHFMLNFIHKIKAGYILAIFIFAANVYFFLPAFQGYFVQDNVKVQIPDNYKMAFDWLSTKDPTHRIAKLPMNTMWGWNYYSWHYEGAGFTWFGIPQPTMDREFDRWSRYNEDFYNQASNTLYGGDTNGFFDTLRKYQVRYLFLDESVTSPGMEPKLLKFDEIKNLVLSDKQVKEVAKFGFITIYDTGIDVGNMFVSSPAAIGVNTDMGYSQYDNVYSVYGDYYTDPKATSYPFSNLGKLGDVKIYQDNGKIIFDNIKIGQKISQESKAAIKEDLSINRGFDSAYNCDLERLGTVEKINSREGILYRADGNGVSCDYLTFEDLEYSKAYVLHLAGENTKGRGLKIYLYNQTENRMNLEEVLPVGKFDKYYFVYPKKYGGGGYILNLETRSYGRVAAENKITKVEFYPVDYNMLTGAKEGVAGQKTDKVKVSKVSKYGTTGYKIDVQGGGLLQLGQGYEKGWMAFTVDPKTWSVGLPEHVKVNSWANGWSVPAGVGTLYIFFVPQLLEWGGMLLVLYGFVWLLKKAPKT